MIRVPDLLVRHVCEPLWDRFEGSHRLRTFRQLCRSQWWPREQLDSVQRERLLQLVQYAEASCAFYRDRFREAGVSPRDIREVGDLPRLPVLTKDDVRENRDLMVANGFDVGTLIPARTGGSSGVPLELFLDSRCRQWRNAAALRADHWSGWTLGQPVAAVWGNPPRIGSLRNRVRRTLKDRVVYLDTMSIEPHAMDRFIDEWRAMRPGLLYGHAHSIFVFAEYVLERGIHLEIDGIVSTSMMLIETERQVIERAFRMPVTDRYGCEEVSLIGCECEEHHGMHMPIEQKVVEFLRDDDTPCPPGEIGRIVVTDLNNYAMPFIRYDTGDRGIPSTRACPCGRGLPLMESITGRSADFLLAGDGRRIAGISLIENTLTKFPGIKQMQLVQPALNELVVYLVPAPDYSTETASALDSAFRDAFGQELSVDIKLVDAIRQETNGKYRFSIREF